MADIQEQSVVMDIDLYGNENRDGTAKEYLDNEAVKTAFTLWLTSKKGEFIRQPTYGGVFDSILFKQMSEEKAEMIAFSIRTAVTNFFSPSIRLLELGVTPNYEQRYWEIYIKYENPFDNQVQSVTIYTKDLSAKDSVDYIQIDYIGDNLYNFCVIKKPSMGGQLLKYDSVKLAWLWDRYLFSSFNINTDPRAADIVEECNR